LYSEDPWWGRICPAQSFLIAQKSTVVPEISRGKPNDYREKMPQILFDRIRDNCKQVWGKEKGPVRYARPFKHLFGGAKRDRTADLLNAIQALSQLSYSPIQGNSL
jgi:hypothetical protein